MKVAAMAAEAARKEENIEAPMSEFENGFRKGIGAALIMFESQPDCSPLIKETLSRMAGYRGEPVKTSDEHPVLWNRPTFTSANDYIRSLDPQNCELSIGNSDGEPVMAELLGHMDVHDVIDDEYDLAFYGRCEILISEESDEFLGYGFILGCISGTGTSIIVDHRDRLYAYSPDIAVDPLGNI
jgi:hypothetical protein